MKINCQVCKGQLLLVEESRYRSAARVSHDVSWGDFGVVKSLNGDGERSVVCAADASHQTGWEWDGDAEKIVAVI